MLETPYVLKRGSDLILLTPEWWRRSVNWSPDTKDCVCDSREQWCGQLACTNFIFTVDILMTSNRYIQGDVVLLVTQVCRQVSTPVLSSPKFSWSQEPPDKPSKASSAPAELPVETLPSCSENSNKLVCRHWRFAGLQSKQVLSTALSGCIIASHLSVSIQNSCSVPPALICLFLLKLNDQRVKL